MDVAEIARAEARMVEQLVSAGRKAAAIDGRHLMLWGLLGSFALGGQYFAEVNDWAPSSILWLWQPFVLTGFAASIFLMRRGPGRRMGNPTSRAYAIAFTGAGFLVMLTLLTTMTGGVPAGLDAARCLCGAMAAAFILIARQPSLRWMLWPAAGWLILMANYVIAGQATPTDWLVLAIALLVLAAAPGMALMAKARA